MKSNLKIAGTAMMLTMAIALFNGCKKSSSDNTVTDAEAGAIVTSATSSSAGGLGYDISQAVTSTTQYGKKGGVNRIQAANCNTPESDTLNWSYNLGGYSFSYIGYTNYELNCNAGNPTSFTVSDGYSGQYSYGTTFSGSANDTSDWTITGIDSSSTAYTFNGSFKQNGTYKESSGSKTFSYTYSISYVVTNVVWNISLQQITGGSASISVTASLNGGSTYSGSGSIVYNSSGTATLTVGSYTTTIPD